MRRTTLIGIVFCILLHTTIFAADIKGHITDKRSGEPVTGAVIKAGTRNAVAGLDGSYLIKDLPAGAYELTVTNVAYQTVQRKITVAANEVITQDFQLEANYSAMSTVIITGTAKNA